MIFTKTEKIIIYLLFILLIIIFIYKINKNGNEHMTISDNENRMADNVIFYKLLKKSFNIQEIPDKINIDSIKNTSIEIIVKSENLNNYLFMYDYTVYLYKYDINSFIIDETIVINTNNTIKILDMDINTFTYPIISIDNDGIIEFKNSSTDEIRKVALKNTTNEIKNNDVVLLINSIRYSMENYLRTLANSFDNINLYNLDDDISIKNSEDKHKEITTNTNNILHGLILQSKNMLHYLFADKVGLYKVSIIKHDDDLRLHIVQIRIKDSEKIIFTSYGNLLSYDDKDKLLYVFVKECNKNVTKLVLSNTGKLIFTDKTDNIYNSLDFVELKDSINKNLLLKDSDIFNQKVDDIFNSVNNINFSYKMNTLPKKTIDINKSLIKPYIKVPPIY
jgi:hypothetical protein